MNDPYLQIDVCVDRLFNDYKKFGKLIVAVDFDDTLYDYHKQGHAYPLLTRIVKECQELGFHIVIFTGNADDKYPFIKEYCKSIGINVEHINKNPIPLPFGNNGAKIFYNILLDDRAGLNQAVDTLMRVLVKIQVEKDKCEISQTKS